MRALFEILRLGARVRVIVALPILLALSTVVQAQTTDGRVRVEVRHGADLVADAIVSAGGTPHVTDAQGVATFAAPVGSLAIEVSKDGFVTVTATVDVEADREVVVHVDLVPAPTVEEEVTVVASTRTGRRIDDQPMRVEVLNREEIEEKMLMTPGDIVMMLNEMGGLRVQATSPALGAASVRIQGMHGRYTRVLSDGLPLFGVQTGGLGLLQIPPMDLGQVEVIKGVASALYGAGAMGGVVNLLSRRPGAEAEREALVNRSTRGATDTVFWLSTPLTASWGLTLLGSGHWQDQVDVDDDDWSDLPGYSRAVVRPRVFWDGGGGRSFFATAGVTLEERDGGNLPGTSPAAIGEAFPEALDTDRFDVGAVGQTLLADRFVLTARAAVSHQRHDHVFGTTRERDRHDTAFGEVAIRGRSGPHTWVGGVAIERDAYRPEDVPRFGYSFLTPGVFVQDDVDVTPWLSLSASARVDHQSDYGTFFSPRVSALVRARGWTSRVSAGRGFFPSTPLTEETEAAGLSRLDVPQPLKAERGQSASVDVGRTDGPLSYTLTLFASKIRDPLSVSRDTSFVLRNLTQATTNVGVEGLATWRREPFTVTTTYTYVRAREHADGGVADVPLTPRHSAGLVAMAESEDAGRVGLEVYVTGRQRLEANPYRAVSAPYVIVGLLAERRIGRFRVFVNGENLTDVRQSRWDPLLRRMQGIDGRWTVDAWAPLEGRVINGGVRVAF